MKNIRIYNRMGGISSNGTAKENKESYKSRSYFKKNFWKDNSRFADLFNACIFDGEQVLKPNDLTEVDTDISSLPTIIFPEIFKI